MPGSPLAAMASFRTVKKFLNGRIGRIVLIAIAILITAAALLVGGVLFGIVAGILFGLGIPIWVGASRPRYLAIVGIAILLAAPPVWAAIEVPYYFAAPSPVNSIDNFLQNATVSPYSAPAGSVFSWEVQVVPAAVRNTTLVNLTLYVSTCPGATGTSDPNCGAGYAFNAYPSPKNVSSFTGETTVWFNETISSANIWYWQMGLYYRNGTHGLAYDSLVGDSSFYNGLIGPIAGDWTTVFGALVGTFYIAVGLYVGIPFYIALLVYVIYRMRREKRQLAAARARASSAAPEAGTETRSRPARRPPSGGAAPLPSAPAPAPAAPPASEQACPNCGAVVYPQETFCWKCGAALGAKDGSSSAPKG